MLSRRLDVQLDTKGKWCLVYGLQRTSFLFDRGYRNCLCCKSGVEFEQFYSELEHGANYKSVTIATIMVYNTISLYSSTVGGSVMLMMICMSMYPS